MNAAAFLAQGRLFFTLALLLLLAGLGAALTMPRQEDPEFPARFGLVVAPSPGSDPLTVEADRVVPLELALARIEEIDEVVATARADLALLEVRLADRVSDPDPVWDEVRREIAAATRPVSAPPPALEEGLVELQAFLVAVTGEEDPQELREAAERVERRLSAVPGVARVERTGDPGAQLTVGLGEGVARQHGLAPEQLAAWVSAALAPVGAGTLRAGDQRIVLGVGQALTSEADLRDLPLPLGGSVVPLQALADVRRGPLLPAEERVRVDGRPAIVVGAVLAPDQDAVAAGERLQAAVRELAAQEAPLQVRALVDQPARVSGRLSELTGSLVSSVAIVFGVLLVTMGLRMGVVVSAIVPLVSLGTLAIYAALGGQLHQMSMAGLVLALGLLVDNAIVVAERVQDRLDEGDPGPTAAWSTVQELAWPLTAATGTTVASFVPLWMSRGATGDFTRAIPETVILSLVLSLIAALTLTPVLATFFFRPRPARAEKRSALGAWLARFPAERPLLVGLVALTLVLGSLSLAPGVRQQFFPLADRDEVVLELALPEGSDLGATERASARLEAALASDSEVVSVAAFLGRSVPPFYYNLARRPAEPHLAQLLVRTREVGSVPGVVARARALVAAEIPEATFVGRPLEQGPPVAAPIELRLQGPDLESLWEAGNRLTQAARELPGTLDVRHDLSPGVTTLAVAPDDAALARAGLTRVDLYRAIAGRTRGITAGTLQEGEEEVPVRVRAVAGEDSEAAQLTAAEVWTPRGPIPVAALADLRVEVGPPAIRRQNGERTLRVLAQVQAPWTAAQVLTQIRPVAEELAQTHGLRLEVGGDQEGSAEANRALFLAAPVGAGLLLTFLLLQFASWRRVGLILLTVPLAAVGVVPGLVLMDQPFGFTSLLGLFALVGIVVNNAILLLDVADQGLKEGLPVEEAATRAVLTRLRPILLTTLTTVCGLLPLMWTSSTLWPPLASALASGLIASTVLTVGVVPAGYVLLMRPRPAGWPRWLLLLGLGAASPAQAASLEDAWRAALDHHPGLAAARAEQAASQAEVARAGSVFLPRLALAAGATLNQEEIALDFGELAPGAEDLEPLFAAFHGAETAEQVFRALPPSEAPAPLVVREKAFADAAAVLTVPIWTPGAGVSWRVARDQASAAAWRAGTVERALRRSVVEAWWGSFVADQAVLVAEGAVERARQAQRVVEARAAAGEAVVLDGLNAELARVAAEEALASARRDRTAAREALRTLTGWALDVPLDPPAEATEGVGSWASRPERALAEVQLQVARRALTGERLAWAPKIEANWTGTWTQNQGFQPESTYWTAGVRAEWLAWDGGARLQAARAAAARVQAAAAQARALDQELARQAAVARADRERAEEGVRVAEQRRALAREAARVSEAAWAVGALDAEAWRSAVQVREEAELGWWAAQAALATARAREVEAGH